jgi:hypothetical protein
MTDLRWESHRLIRLRLEAAGRGSLFPLVHAACGSVLQARFRLDDILAFGSQSHVFSGTDLIDGRDLVIKIPAFDYCRPVIYGREETGMMRSALMREHAVLSACTTGHLPAPVALVVGESPIPAACSSPYLQHNEVLLVEERIIGATTTEMALRAKMACDGSRMESRIGGMLGSFVEFWISLQQAGWIYTDISGNNLVIEERTGRLRVVDAGSAVATADQVVLTACTPSFTTPRLAEAIASRTPRPGDLSLVLPMLAKLLVFLISRREPLNAALPDLDDPALAPASPACRRALAAMLDLDGHPEHLPDALEQIRGWVG